MDLKWKKVIGCTCIGRQEEYTYKQYRITRIKVFSWEVHDENGLWFQACSSKECEEKVDLREQKAAYQKVKETFTLERINEIFEGMRNYKYGLLYAPLEDFFTGKEMEVLNEYWRSLPGHYSQNSTFFKIKRKLEGKAD